MTKTIIQKPSIVLFDGECSFCDASVQFILKRDPAGKFNFASLQSEVGMQLLAQHDLPADVSTMVLIEKGQAFTRSSAALKVARKLSGMWFLFYAFMLVPKSIRDGVYNLIAKHRYRLMGRKEACALPDPAVRGRFLGE